MLLEVSITDTLFKTHPKAQVLNEMVKKAAPKAPKVSLPAPKSNLAPKDLKALFAAQAKPADEKEQDAQRATEAPDVQHEQAPTIATDPTEDRLPADVEMPSSSDPPGQPAAAAPEAKAAQEDDLRGSQDKTVDTCSADPSRGHRW